MILLDVCVLMEFPNGLAVITAIVSPFRVQLFRNECAREAYEKLNSKRKIWVERSVILDEVDPAIRANLESRG